MKTILVLTGSSETDSVVFETALAAAQPLGAHLEFLHIRISPGQAAEFTPRVDFARGVALRDALDRLKATGERRSASASRHFQEFCERQAIEIAQTPSPAHGVTASWCEEQDDAVERILLHARHNDLVILARPSRPNGLPPALIELLLVRCGRPLLVAPPRPRQSLTGTVLVCWKETAAAARALGAALPLLSKSKRVVTVGVEEAAGGSLDGLRDLARQLAWHGIAAEISWKEAEAGSAAAQLEADGDRYDADLLVMGGYGHSGAREIVFGGCTQHFLEAAGRPVLLMH